MLAMNRHIGVELHRGNGKREKPPLVHLFEEAPMMIRIILVVVVLVGTVLVLRLSDLRSGSDIDASSLHLQNVVTNMQVSDKPIHPGLISALIGSISDSRPIFHRADLRAALDSNQFYSEITSTPDGKVTSIDSGCRNSYKIIESNFPDVKLLFEDTSERGSTFRWVVTLRASEGDVFKNSSGDRYRPLFLDLIEIDVN
jgi:hypothetical protein